MYCIVRKKITLSRENDIKTKQIIPQKFQDVFVTLVINHTMQTP